IDIVDIDPSTPQCTTSTPSTSCKPNLDIKSGEFPCDLFQYIFGDQAWQDTDSDGFCETRITTSLTGTNGKPYTIGEDENYLLAKAKYIIVNSSVPYAADMQYLTTATLITASCSGDVAAVLPSGYSGIIWDQQGCGLKSALGSADTPVVL